MACSLLLGSYILHFYRQKKVEMSCFGQKCPYEVPRVSFMIDGTHLQHAAEDVISPTLFLISFVMVDLRPELIPASKYYKNLLLTRPNP
jgi:hypothetical protein